MWIPLAISLHRWWYVHQLRLFACQTLKWTNFPSSELPKTLPTSSRLDNRWSKAALTTRTHIFHKQAEGYHMTKKSTEWIEKHINWKKNTFRWPSKILCVIFNQILFQLDDEEHCSDFKWSSWRSSIMKPGIIQNRKCSLRVLKRTITLGLLYLICSSLHVMEESTVDDICSYFFDSFNTSIM